MELEADRFVGFMMFRRGANLEAAERGFGAAVIKAKSSSEGLSADERIKAVADGWNEAQQLSSLTSQSAPLQKEGESKNWATVRNETVKPAVYRRFILNFKSNQKVAYEAAQEYLRMSKDVDDTYTKFLKRWTAAYEARQK